MDNMAETTPQAVDEICSATGRRRWYKEYNSPQEELHRLTSSDILIRPRSEVGTLKFRTQCSSRIERAISRKRKMYQDLWDEKGTLELQWLVGKRGYR